MTIKGTLSIHMGTKLVCKQLSSMLELTGNTHENSKRDFGGVVVKPFAFHLWSSEFDPQYLQKGLSIKLIWTWTIDLNPVLIWKEYSQRSAALPIWLIHRLS